MSEHASYQIESEGDRKRYVCECGRSGNWRRDFDNYRRITAEVAIEWNWKVHAALSGRNRTWSTAAGSTSGREEAVTMTMRRFTRAEYGTREFFDHVTEHGEATSYNDDGSVHVRVTLPRTELRDESERLAARVAELEAALREACETAAGMAFTLRCFAPDVNTDGADARIAELRQLAAKDALTASTHER